MTQIRSTHPYGYRSGRWADIIGVVMGGPNGCSRPCYHVQFEDGSVDQWPVYDDAQGYEFRAGQERTEQTLDNSK